MLKIILLQQFIRRPFLQPRSNIRKFCQRFQSNDLNASSPPQNVCALKHRAVVEVKGKDSGALLQGLITNNINTLSDEQPLIYAMLLNDKGRCVHDLLIYRGCEEQEYLLECDAHEDVNLIELLKRYKLRKKVQFKQRRDMQVCCVFQPTPSTVTTNDDVIRAHNDLSETDQIFQDPRYSHLGHRILTPSVDSLRLQEQYNAVPLEAYTRHRYVLGVGEGHNELGGVIPLEQNLQWLNGVAFDKGCYIGQELVARVHFTGQVRKRLMPLCLERHTEHGSDIRDGKGRRVGRVLACMDGGEVSEGSGVNYFVGIGVVNVERGRNVESSCFSTTQLHVSGDGAEKVKVVATAPLWWPQKDDV